MGRPVAAERRFEEHAVGQSFEVRYCIGNSDMSAFAELSDDYNPLHLDVAFARAAGFDAQVVYGGIHFAKVSQLIGMLCPGRNGVLTHVDLSFHNPLYVGQTAVLTGVVKAVVESVRVVRLELRIESEGRLIARGRAEARVNAE